MTQEFIIINRKTLEKKKESMGHKAVMAASKMESAYVIKKLGTFSEIIYRKG